MDHSVLQFPINPLYSLGRDLELATSPSYALQRSAQFARCPLNCCVGEPTNMQHRTGPDYTPGFWWRGILAISLGSVRWVIGSEMDDCVFVGSNGAGCLRDVRVYFVCEFRWSVRCETMCTDAKALIITSRK